MYELRWPNFVETPPRSERLSDRLFPTLVILYSWWNVCLQMQHSWSSL